MTRSLAALLDGVIDYAGLFPPAALSMPRAVEEYLGHVEGDDYWLVNRFICPVARLGEFQEAFLATGSDSAFEISAIGTSTPEIAGFARSVEEDRRAIETFESQLQGQITIEGIEIRIPQGPIEQIIRALNPIADFELYLESPLDEGLLDRLHAIAKAEIAGAKARTGGLEKSSFPAPRVLAEFIRECLDLSLPFKLTAGLHHPLRAPDPATGGVMHGFLNVLAGTVLADESDLSRGELAMILEEQNARAFEFDESGLRWRNYAASIETIESVRTLFVGFGSCSVTEPIEDLTKLGLL